MKPKPLLKPLHLFLWACFFLAAALPACATGASPPPSPKMLVTPASIDGSTLEGADLPTQPPTQPTYTLYPTYTPYPTYTMVPTPTPIEAANPGPQEIVVTVSRVIDGDTFEARLSDGSDQYVRLLGVDAPESFRRNEPNEYEDITNTVCLDEWGHRATVFVRDRLEGRGVILILASNGAERSLFGDLLAFVLVDGQDFNAMLVTLGYARVFTDEYSGRQEEYLVLQQQSEQSNLGLWACRDASSTPSATETPTRLPGPQATATPTAQPTVSPSPTVVLPPTATLIPTPTRTATTTPTVAPAPTTASELLATATPEPSATSMPLPTSTPIPTPSVGSIVIECIFFDGVVPRSESDEYVQIANLGSGTVDLVGWRLADVDDGTPEFTFPSYVLSPGARVRVYTNEIHPESGGFSFGRGSSIWNNGSPDTAGLFNSQGVQVSTKSYPPGCE